MLQKTKSFVSLWAQKALILAKSNIPATISVALTLAAIILTTVCSAHTVNIYDGRNTYSVLTLSKNPDVILAKADLDEKNFEIVGFKNGFFADKLEIAYLVPLTIKRGGEVNTYKVREGLLSDLIADAGISLDEHDIISLSLNYYVDKATEVEITDVEFITTVSTESVYTNDKNTVAIKTITTLVKYVNGVATEVVSSYDTVDRYFINQSTIQGATAPSYTSGNFISAGSANTISTLPVPNSLLLDENGVPVEYVAKSTLRATAYTHTGNKMSTGKYPKPGYVAVDPKEIPYGTKMYIVSADGQYIYGYAIAADTGGFIYGTRADIDLFLDTEAQCEVFGRRDVIVYFIK